MPYELHVMIKDKTAHHPNWWDRWIKKSIVPHVVLLDLWDHGILIMDTEPKTGIKLIKFMELLWKSACSPMKGKDQEGALSLFLNTVESSYYPSLKGKIKTRNGK